MPVTPTIGVRSPQLASFGTDDLAMSQAVPTCVDQFTAPVAASSPYTQSFSVATTTVDPTTSGCAYTCPDTGVSNSWVNVGTTDGPMFGSLASQPLRITSCEAVTSSARAVPAVVPGRAPVSAGSAPSMRASPVMARSSRRAEMRTRYPRGCMETPQ